MKKMLLGAVGLSAVLASCGDLTVTLNPFVPDIGTRQPSTTLRLTELSSFTTNWQLSEKVRDQNGQIISAGSYLICDNRNTDLTVNLKWTGDLRRLYVQFRGANSGATRGVNYFNFTGNTTSGSGTATYTFAPGTAPLSLNPQAIIVNPIKNVNVKGYTYVQLQGLDQNGNYSNVIQSVTQIPVVDCQG